MRRMASSSRHLSVATAAHEHACLLESSSGSSSPVMAGFWARLVVPSLRHYASECSLSMHVGSTSAVAGRVLLMPSRCKLFSKFGGKIVPGYSWVQSSILQYQCANFSCKPSSNDAVFIPFPARTFPNELKQLLRQLSRSPGMRTRGERTSRFLIMNNVCPMTPLPACRLPCCMLQRIAIWAISMQLGVESLQRHVIHNHINTRRSPAVLHLSIRRQAKLKRWLRMACAVTSGIFVHQALV